MISLALDSSFVPLPVPPVNLTPVDSDFAPPPPLPAQTQQPPKPEMDQAARGDSALKAGDFCLCDHSLHPSNLYQPNRRVLLHITVYCLYARLPT